jgi:hypothetical protein
MAILVILFKEYLHLLSYLVKMMKLLLFDVYYNVYIQFRIRQKVSDPSGSGFATLLNTEYHLASGSGHSRMALLIVGVFQACLDVREAPAFWGKMELLTENPLETEKVCHVP